MRADDAEFVIRLTETDPRLQACEHRATIDVTRFELFFTGYEGRPHVGLGSKPERRLRGHNADHCVRLTVQGDSFSNNSGIGAEPFFPEGDPSNTARLPGRMSEAIKVLPYSGCIPRTAKKSSETWMFSTRCGLSSLENSFQDGAYIAREEKDEEVERSSAKSG